MLAVLSGGFPSSPPLIRAHPICSALTHTYTLMYAFLMTMTRGNSNMNSRNGVGECELC